MGPKIIFQNQITTFRDFLNAYNETIEKLVQISHFGLSGKIEHEVTAQEQHLLDELNDQVTGIPDLKDETKEENGNFINKFMGLIHSV